MADPGLDTLLAGMCGGGFECVHGGLLRRRDISLRIVEGAAKRSGWQHNVCKLQLLFFVQGLGRSGIRCVPRAASVRGCLLCGRLRISRALHHTQSRLQLHYNKRGDWLISVNLVFPTVCRVLGACTDCSGGFGEALSRRSAPLTPKKCT